MDMQPLGPVGLGFELDADASVSADGWLERALVARPGLDGPTGILQGGFAAGICASIASEVDPHGAPLTAIDARLHAPTPLGRPVRARVRQAEALATYEVELRDEGRLLVSATVELAGHEPAAHAYDLLELGTAPVPEAAPQDAYPHCWLCGGEPIHPLAQRLHPRYLDEETVVIPWVADDELAADDGSIDPLVVAAVLDCPTAWVTMGHVRSLGHGGALLAGYHLTVLREAPTMEVLRTVARFDAADGRKLTARGALVDDEGITYAVSSAVHVSVPEVPSLPYG